jgi:hypothetical protein
VAMNDGAWPPSGRSPRRPVPDRGRSHPLVDSVSGSSANRRGVDSVADEHRLTSLGLRRGSSRCARPACWARADAGRGPPHAAADVVHAKIPESRSTRRRLRGWTGWRARRRGLRVWRPASVIAALRGVDRIAGVHVMAPGWEVEAVPAVMEAAGLAVGRAGGAGFGPTDEFRR